MGVMEMTFPHQALRQDSVTRLLGHRSVLAVASARQAESRTVALLRQAERGPVSISDEAEQRIRYFSRRDGQRSAARGAFWQQITPERITEAPVYHADLANIKDVPLIDQATGEQSNHAGHGALRTI
jgi:hypothetical protein